MPRRAQGWLAAQLGITRQRVNQLISEGLFAKKREYTPADVAKFKPLLLEARAANNATAASIEEAGDESEIRAMSKNPERVARIKLIIERTAKIKLERELLAGGYVKREDVEKEMTARVYSVRAKLQEIPQRSALIANKSDAECEAILSGWMREVCEHYANGGGS